MKIYTRTGDDGSTGLYRGGRRSKSDPRVEAYGAVDETNALLGVCRAHGGYEDIDALLAGIQARLFEIGAELASVGEYDKQRVEQSAVDDLERSIDALEAEVEPLRSFILPGGADLAAQLHHARTVCRRAERQVVGLSAVPGEDVRELVIVYLNRLSDWLFVAARAANARARVAEDLWP